MNACPAKVKIRRVDGNNLTMASVPSVLHLVTILFVILLKARTGRAAQAPQDLLRDTLTRTLSPVENTTLVRSSRSGPVQNVFRSTLSTFLTCTPNTTHTCRPAASRLFGTVGNAYYFFNHSDHNFIGQSLQAIIACRCLNTNCSHAVQIRPVTIVDDDDKHTAVYIAIDNGGVLGYPDCLSQVYRVVPNRRNEQLPQVENTPLLQFSVADARVGDFWNVSAYRGWHYRCTKADVLKLPTINVSTIATSALRPLETTFDLSSPCKPKGASMMFRAMESEEEEVAAIYKRAAEAAMIQGSGQDCFANGREPRAYLSKASVSLVSDTELALACSAALLGLLFMIGACRKFTEESDQGMVTKKRLSSFLFAQIIYLVLETLPLLVLLIIELQASRWRSVFAFIDAVRVTSGASDQDKISTDGVLLITETVGDIQHLYTRTGLLFTLTLTLVVLSILVIATVFWRAYQVGRKTDSSDFEEDDKDSDESLKWLPKIVRRRRRGVKRRLLRRKGSARASSSGELLV